MMTTTTTTAPSKKKKSKIPKKEKTTNFKLSTISVIVGVLVLIGATAPFWNAWVDSDSEQEFLKFSNLSIFLYAFGNHFALFCCAFFVFWIKNFVDPQHKSVIRIINAVGFIFLFISVYFLLWIFSPVSDFPQYIYEIAFILLSILITYGVYIFNGFIARITLENKYNVTNLTAFIFRIRNKYFFPMAFNAINKDNREKIEEDIEKFDEEVFETLDEL